MSVDGTWKMIIEGPTGPQHTVLTLTSAGGVVSGTQSTQGETQAISDCKLAGDTLSWVNHLSKPMKLKLQFTAAIAGNTMSGKVNTGFMGSYSFTAVKE